MLAAAWPRPHHILAASSRLFFPASPPLPSFPPASSVDMARAPQRSVKRPDSSASIHVQDVDVLSPPLLFISLNCAFNLCAPCEYFRPLLTITCICLCSPPLLHEVLPEPNRDPISPPPPLPVCYFPTICFDLFSLNNGALKLAKQRCNLKAGPHRWCFAPHIKNN